MKRLGKQRVETLQVLNVFAGVRAGWGNHPITRMWTNHERWLMLYGLKICDEWISRGYRDTCRGKILALSDRISGDASQAPPPWLGDHAFHLSHQSNLVRKNADFYGPQFPSINGTMEYVWPELSISTQVIRNKCSSCGYAIHRRRAYLPSDNRPCYGPWVHSLSVRKACLNNDGLAAPDPKFGVRK